MFEYDSGLMFFLFNNYSVARVYGGIFFLWCIYVFSRIVLLTSISEVVVRRPSRGGYLNPSWVMVIRARRAASVCFFFKFYVSGALW